jgi:hypothetical protein
MAVTVEQGTNLSTTRVVVCSLAEVMEPAVPPSDEPAAGAKKPPPKKGAPVEPEKVSTLQTFVQVLDIITISRGKLSPLVTRYKPSLCIHDFHASL